jgi:hypothetical protein
MQRVQMLIVLVILALAGAFPAQPVMGAPPTPAAPAGWNAPTLVGAATWPDLRNFSISADGARLVALDYLSGSDDHTRRVVTTEWVNGAWQPLTVIAENGVYATGSMVWLPQYTHPVISGDGSVIVYLGWTGATNAPYAVDRLAGGGWSAPALVPAGLGNTHYWLSLSHDGKTLALASYSLFGVDHVYVMTRGSGGWSAPVRVSAESGLLEGGQMPALSADGRKLVYVQNARATFTEQIGGQWTAPVQLTANNHWEGERVEYPQLSGDGRAIVYWLVRSTGSTLTDQTLYVMRRTGGVWGAAEQVNSRPNIPIHEISQAPVAVNREATRLLYTRTITTYDPELGPYVYASDLDIAEWRAGAWHESTLVATDGWLYQWWPRLTPDGMKLIFKSGAQMQQMATDTAPTPLPLPTSTSAVITPAGGELYSEIDQTRYQFPAATFTATVHFTHTVAAPQVAPPPGHSGIGGVGGLGHGFAATALGPGGLPLQPTQGVTVTVDYSATGPGATIPGTRCLWWLGVQGWEPLPSVDDPATGLLTATVDHFSTFAVFGETHSIFLPAVQRSAALPDG